MTEQQKFDYLVSPEKLFPSDFSLGSLRNNTPFLGAVSKYCDLLRESQFWPRERLRELQTKRLRLFTGRIAARSLFWANLFRERSFFPSSATSNDLKRLPVFSRVSFHKLGDAPYVEPQPEDKPIYRRKSSGTTGVPLDLVYNEREMIRGYLPFSLRHPAFERGSLVEFLSRRPFVVLGMPGGRYTREKDFVFSTFKFLKAPDLENRELRNEIYASINAAAPTILHGYASLIAQLSHWAADDHVTLPIAVIKIASEPISQEEKEIIRRVLKAPIVNILQGSGAGGIGFECPENIGHFHTNSENIILEVVGEDGAILPEGEVGELVVTSLTFTLTPIVRFALNDLGRMVLQKNCPCGRTLPLFEVHGRRGYDVILPSGKKVRIIHILSALMGQGLSYKSKQIQVIQDKPDNLRILIVPKNRLSSEEEINVRLALTGLFEEEKMNIEIEYVENIPAGRGNKPQFFVPLSDVSAP